MFDTETITQLKNQLQSTFDNYISRVAAKAEISRPTVSKFFNFKKIRTFSAIKIYDAGLELLKEESEQERSRVAMANQLLREDPRKRQTSMKFR